MSSAKEPSSAGGEREKKSPAIIKLAAHLGIAPVKRFCEISPIHGCSYMGTCDTGIEGVLWFTLIAICFGFCISNTITLVEQYLSVPTQISVLTARNNTQLFSSAVFCFDVFRPMVVAGINKRFNESLFNETLSALTARHVAESKQPSFTELPLNDPDWDMLVKTTYVLLMSIVDYDIEAPGNMMTPLDNVTQSAVDLVANFYQQNSYDYAMLLDGTARYFCQQALDPNHANCTFQYVLDQSDTSCFEICKSASLKWFGQTEQKLDDICFSLKAANLTLFETANDFFAVAPFYVSRASLLVDDWHTSYGTVLLGAYGPPNVYVDLRSGEGLIDARYGDSVIAVGDNTTVWFGAELISISTAYNKSTNPCTSESEVTCAIGCLSSTRQAVDHCIPLASYLRKSASSSTNVSICTRRFTDAEIANVSARSLPDYTSRFKSCLFGKCPMVPCNTSSYQFKIYPSSNSFGVYMNMQPSRFIFPIFIESPSMDISAFLAAFGGILGLWVGGSLIALIHIPLFMADQMIRRWCESRRKGGGTSSGRREKPIAKTIAAPPQYSTNDSDCNITYI